jgi:uncharacterized delta-60 repeat protein
LQADGKVLVTHQYGCIRLNSDGSHDTNFITTGELYYGPIALQSDGKILVGEDHLNESPVIARLNANGSRDTSFSPWLEIYGVIYSIIVQSDGKIIVCGVLFYHRQRHQPQPHRPPQCRWQSGQRFQSRHRSGRSCLCGRVADQRQRLIGGPFLSVNGVWRPRIARLYGAGVVLPLINIARSNALVIVSWPVTALNFQLRETTNLALANAWALVAQPAVTNGAQISVTVPAGAGPKFFRLKSQ